MSFLEEMKAERDAAQAAFILQKEENLKEEMEMRIQILKRRTEIEELTGITFDYQYKEYFELKAKIEAQAKKTFKDDDLFTL